MASTLRMSSGSALRYMRNEKFTRCGYECGYLFFCSCNLNWKASKNILHHTFLPTYFGVFLLITDHRSQKKVTPARFIHRCQAVARENGPKRAFRALWPGGSRQRGQTLGRGLGYPHYLTFSSDPNNKLKAIVGRTTVGSETFF